MVLRYEYDLSRRGTPCRPVPDIPASDTVEVVVARLDIEQDGLKAAEILLSETERQRAARFALPVDRERFIISRSRLRRLLGRRLGIPPADVELVCGPHGKPALGGEQAASGERFNLSHSGNIVAYVFSTGREVGIDIEALHAVDGADDIAECCFSRREQVEYHALPREARPLGFLNCWTRKEAFIKATGNALYHAFDSFDVSLTPGQPAAIRRVGPAWGKDCGWSLHSFSPGPGIVGAVVVEGRDVPCPA